MSQEESASPKYIIVIGASAGGLNSVIEVTAQLKEEMNAAVFVVLHLTNISSSEILISRIQKNSPYTCKPAEDDEPIRSGYIYLAVPDKHLIVKGGKMKLGKGPAENRWRPSIDVLFRSAAANYDGRVIGIVLTGLLQDGTSGMQAVKRCGGTCIVQDPNEAEYPDMPLSVLNNIEVDYCVRLEEMGDLLLEKTKNGVNDSVSIPPDVMAEAQIDERVALGIEDVSQLGEKSLYSCPECSGGLWEIRYGNFVRYRCHTGHSYTQDELALRQNQALESTLWVALRMMEERKNLLQKMANEETSKGWIRSAANKKDRASELEEHIERLKQILFDSQKE